MYIVNADADWKNIHVCLVVGAKPRDIFQAFFHAVVLKVRYEKSVARKNFDRESVFKEADAQVAKEFSHVWDKLRSRGWHLNEISVCPSNVRMILEEAP